MEEVHAASALVLAPHYDDEVLGCGGLIAQLAAAGGVVRVLFLTDSGGGREEVGDREAYRRRRRGEAARAAEVLGIAGHDHLELPDGALEQHLDAAVRGISRALISQRPELVLLPSPLEVTADHRAVFAAFHRLLAPLRDSPLASPLAPPLPAPVPNVPAVPNVPNGPNVATSADAPGLLAADVLSRLRILLYEVNHPGYPDLLVEVSHQAELLAAAMACYASQEERHAYLDAGLGLRRFRTLSLGREVALAEGYRRLSPADFTTRSPAQLLRHLGGVPELLEVREGPLISVVVRTRDRPALLAEALGSLAGSSYTRAEVVLVNDGGAPPAVPAGFPLKVVPVELPVSRGRAGAAAAGIAAAAGDFITFLDDDDLAAPEHLATLAGLAGGAGVRVAYTDAAVAVYDLDPSGGWVCRERRLPYSRDFDPDVLLVDNYIPFNTLVMERGLLLAVGPPDATLPFFEDWDLLLRLAERTTFHHLARVTCEYRHFRGAGHHIFGERPRERGDFLAVKARVLAKHAPRLSPEALARAVDTLRADLVAEREDRASSRRELADLTRAQAEAARERFAAEQRYHALNGELAALRGDHTRALAEVRRAGEEIHALLAEGERGRQQAAQLTAEMQRRHDEEGRLRAVEADQRAHLERTYAEIDRLNRLVGEMQATRAWRLHSWWQRRRP